MLRPDVGQPTSWSMCLTSIDLRRQPHPPTPSVRDSTVLERVLNIYLHLIKASDTLEIFI